MKKPLALILSLLAGSLIAPAVVETYEIDPTHSSVKFSIRHFVSKTTGQFNNFEGTFVVDRDNWSNSSVNAVITVDSIDTENKKRDAHLRRSDYLDVKKYPSMTFESTKWETTDEENVFQVTGNLTLLDTTKEVVLNFDLLGFGPGPSGVQLSGWEATTMIDRTEWGITSGQPAIGTEVDITINIEAILQ